MIYTNKNKERSNGKVINMKWSNDMSMDFGIENQYKMT